MSGVAAIVLGTIVTCVVTIIRLMIADASIILLVAISVVLVVDLVLVDISGAVTVGTEDVECITRVIIIVGLVIIIIAGDITVGVAVASLSSLAGQLAVVAVGFTTVG